MSEIEARSEAPQRPEPSPSTDVAPTAGSATGSAGAPGAAAGEATAADGAPSDGAAGDTARKRRRRGSRGGRKRSKPRPEGTTESNGSAPDELPDPPGEGQPSVEAAEKSLVRKAPLGAPNRPKIGDTM